MTLQEFRESLLRDEPPRELSAALAGLWWDAKGDWTRAHQSAQRDEGTDGSFGKASDRYDLAKPKKSSSLISLRFLFRIGSHCRYQLADTQQSESCTTMVQLAISNLESRPCTSQGLAESHLCRMSRQAVNLADILPGESLHPPPSHILCDKITLSEALIQ